MVPSAAQVVVGTRLSIRIEIIGAANVGSVPFHVIYNPAVLRFEKGEEGRFMQGGGRATAFFAAPMSNGNEMAVGLSRLGPGGGIEGAGDLCTLDFAVVGPGDAGLAFARAQVRDSLNRIIQAVFQPALVTAHE
jgi:hypothetical protein